MKIGDVVRLLLSAETGLTLSKGRDITAEFSRRVRTIQGALAEQLEVSEEHVGNPAHQEVELKTGAAIHVDDFKTWLTENEIDKCLR